VAEVDKPEVDHAETVTADVAEPKPIETDMTAADVPVNLVTFRRTEKVQRREKLRDWTQIFANILVPIAIAVAAGGLYLDNLQRGRDTASRQIELLYSEGLSASQVTLFNLWRGQDMSVLENAVSRTFVDQFVSRKIDASDIDKNEIISAIVSLTSYFDRVEICVSSGRCDEAEIVTQIGTYGRDFHCFYAGQINALRNQSLINYLGEGLRDFAERSGGCGQ
jgi:hypothetical protein